MKRSEAVRLEAAAMREAAELASEVFGLGTTDPKTLRDGATDRISYVKGCVAAMTLAAEGAEKSAKKAEAEGD